MVVAQEREGEKGVRKRGGEIKIEGIYNRNEQA
jgi:hypothetical protein